MLDFILVDGGKMTSFGSLIQLKLCKSFTVIKLFLLGWTLILVLNVNGTLLLLLFFKLLILILPRLRIEPSNNSCTRLFVFWIKKIIEPYAINDTRVFSYFRIFWITWYGQLIYYFVFGGVSVFHCFIYDVYFVAILLVYN